MRPLNTTLDYGWISYGEKVPHLKIFLEPILVVDRRITVTLTVTITIAATVTVTITITMTVTVTVTMTTSTSISITITIRAFKNL